jgi:hypothetical protein
MRVKTEGDYVPRRLAAGGGGGRRRNQVAGKLSFFMPLLPLSNPYFGLPSRAWD